jgi:hypothetical protein
MHTANVVLGHQMHDWVEVPHYNAQQSVCRQPECYAVLWAEDDRVEGAPIDYGCLWVASEISSKHTRIVWHSIVAPQPAWRMRRYSQHIPNKRVRRMATTENIRLQLNIII